VLIDVDEMSDGTVLWLVVNNYTVSIDATGTECSLVELGEQLAWLGSALRSSPSEEKMAYSTANIRTLNSSLTPHFFLEFRIEDLKADEIDQLSNGNCWQPLFKNPVVVKGYPILTRDHGERGLEIPLDMMASLGDASRTTVFDRSIVIKGFCTLFVMTKRIENSVLWHFLFNQDGSRISYSDASVHCLDHAPVEASDISCLGSKRHFLGWASSVVMQAGKMNS
jgi:hypothetical protein